MANIGGIIGSMGANFNEVTNNAKAKNAGNSSDFAAMLTALQAGSQKTQPGKETSLFKSGM